MKGYAELYYHERVLTANIDAGVKYVSDICVSSENWHRSESGGRQADEAYWSSALKTDAKYLHDRQVRVLSTRLTRDQLPEKVVRCLKEIGPATAPALH